MHMAYNPITDFVGLWRNTAGSLSKLEFPGLDFVVAALARAGVITVSVSATAPTVNQSTTAWLKAAVPSTSAEGQLFLWDPIANTYAAATPKLFLLMLEAAAGQNGVSWWASTGGAPANTVGNNGDFAIRTDQPGGIYGPKVLGAWPATPLPGTTTGFVSTDLDNAFGGIPGNVLYRDTSVWKALAIGAANTLMVSGGAAPLWEGLSALMDATLGAVRGDVLYRGAAGWTALPPSTAGFALKTNGAGTDPSWAVPEFPSGTTMLFQQTAAPTGWTKQTALNDVGLRVVSGTAGSTGGTAFSTVFAQNATGGHQLTVLEMPSHSHPTSLDGKSAAYEPGGAGGNGITAAGVSAQVSTQVFTMSNAGGDQAHTHPISLQLAYVDVIIATKN